MSMVSDYYNPLIPQPNTYIPYTSTATATTVTYAPDLSELRQLIKEFREAMEAAKLIDKLTNQPDCTGEGVDKQGLLERVEALEQIIYGEE